MTPKQKIVGKKLKINEWSIQDRPREKLINNGASSLSDAELLAILIGSGTPEDNAVDLMKKVLNDCGNNLTELGRLDVETLMQYKGIGEAKAVTIVAACEIGRRREVQNLGERPIISNSVDALKLMKPIMKDSSVELVYLLMMTPNGRLIKMKNVTTRGYDASIFDIKMIMREAIQNEAAMILVAHNHPKGTAAPSTFDNEATKQLTDACCTLDVLLMDHIIIGEEDFFSYRMTHKL